MKLGVLTSHPIQNQAPLFRALAQQCDLVVFFAHRQTPGGQAAAGFNVAFEWDVDLLSGYQSIFLDNVAAEPDTSKFFGCNTPTVADHIMKGNFDAFLVTGWNLYAYWQAIIACRRQRVPVMVRGDSHLMTVRSSWKRMAKSALYPLLLRSFSACLYVGQQNRKYLKYYGVADERLFFSPHCVDNAYFSARAGSADLLALRQQLGIGAAQKVVLYVGKLLPRKRVGDLLPALQRLKAAGIDAVGLIAGDGPLRDELDRQAHAMGVTLKCAGFKNQSELPAFYALADVLVLLSSAEETWGLVVNEALACGTPAVVSDSVGCGEDLVVPRASGVVYPTGDCEQLAEALLQVLQGGWSAEAIATLAERYSAAAAAAGVLAAMKFMKGGHGAEA